MRFQRAFVPTTALAKHVDFDDLSMRRDVYRWPRSQRAAQLVSSAPRRRARQRTSYEICGGGVSLHWPDVDEDLSIAGLMAGVDRNAL